MATHRASIASATSTDSVMLTESEQERVVEELKEHADKQVRSSRSMFFVLYMLISLIFICCILHSVMFPMEMNHQEVFVGIVSNLAFILFYLLSCAVFSAAGIFIKVSGSKHLLVFIFVLSLVSITWWGNIFWVNEVSTPSLYWLPLANPMGTLLAVYIDSDAKGIYEQVLNLEKSKYRLKDV